MMLILFCTPLFKIHDTPLHQCVPDEGNINFKKAIHNAEKKTSEDADCTVPKLSNAVLGDLRNRGYELVVYAPQFSNIKSTLYRQRNQAQGL
jgi:hypothetical protein